MRGRICPGLLRGLGWQSAHVFDSAHTGVGCGLCKKPNCKPVSRTTCALLAVDDDVEPCLHVADGSGV